MYVFTQVAQIQYWSVQHDFDSHVSSHISTSITSAEAEKRKIDENPSSATYSTYTKFHLTYTRHLTYIEWAWFKSNIIEVCGWFAILSICSPSTNAVSIFLYLVRGGNGARTLLLHILFSLLMQCIAVSTTHKDVGLEILQTYKYLYRVFTSKLLQYLILCFCFFKYIRS